MEQLTFNIIAKMHSDFPEKFGIPRQSGLADSLESIIVFEPEYRNADALRGLEDFSHIWIIWQFSETVRSNWTPTVRPPRLGGNTRMGVFATRSPFRPNPIGLSCVKILGLEQTPEYGTVIKVSGADLLNGTPILDIKPYIPYADAHPDAAGGFTAAAGDFILDVQFDDAELNKVRHEKRQALLEVLSHDPRPSYQQDPARIYGLKFDNYNIKFQVQGQKLIVIQVDFL